jgi:phage tail-like protein
MPAPARKDPFKNYSFLVEIDGITQAAFSEVSGLSGTAEVIEYREGADVTSTRKLPGLIKYGNVTLKRGITTSRELFDWWTTVVNGTIQRRNVAIVLLDDNRTEILRWLLRNTWIAKFEVGPLRAEGNDVLIESIELANEGFELA